VYLVGFTIEIRHAFHDARSHEHHSCGRGLRSSGVVQHHGPEGGNLQVLTQIYTIIALSHAF